MIKSRTDNPVNRAGAAPADAALLQSLLAEKEDEMDALKSTIMAQKIALLERDQLIKELRQEIQELHKDQDLCLKCKNELTSTE